MPQKLTHEEWEKTEGWKKTERYRKVCEVLKEIEEREQKRLEAEKKEALALIARKKQEALDLENESVAQKLDRLTNRIKRQQASLVQE